MMQFALVTAAVALQVGVSPVQKVIELLGDLESKVETDLANEAKTMEEFTSWCDEEANEKEDAIRSSKRTRNDLMATIQDATATIGTLTSELDELTTKISSSERELDEATRQRHEQHSDFTSAETELVGTVDSLTRAQSVLKKNLGFLQSGKVTQALELVAEGLGKVVEASWVNSQEKAVLQSLLQQGNEQPQATVHAYESQSSGILDTMADMQEKAEKALSGTRKSEMESAHAFAMLKQGLEDEIAVMKKQLAEKTSARSVATEEQHSAETALTETEAVLAADTKYLAELKQSCQAKAVEWSQRQKQAGEETAAIQKAKDILADGVKVLLLQTASRVRRFDGSTREQVVAALQRAARSAGGYSLAQLVGRAKSDPFGKIRGLIEAMVSKLQKEAAEEADQKAFCDKALADSRESQASLSAKAAKSGARIDKAVATAAKLVEEVQELESEVADISAGQASATKIRQEEHADYLTASSDYKASATAVAKAIEVLTNYYSSAAFVQMSGGPKSDVASTITGILEVAEADFTRLLAESEAGEAAAQEKYDDLSKDNAVAKATKVADAKGKGDAQKQLEVALGNFRDNRATTQAELDAVLKYLDELKPQCEAKVMSYAERVARREAELSGLQEALTLLGGE